MDSERLASQSPRTIVIATDILREQGQREEALKILRAAQLRDPSDFWINQRLGMAWAKRTAADQLHYCSVAVALRPKSLGAWTNFGAALSNAGRIEDSIHAAREAIRLKPDYAVAYSNLGKSLSDLGRLDEAIQAPLPAGNHILTSKT